MFQNLNIYTNNENENNNYVFDKYKLKPCNEYRYRSENYVCDSVSFTIIVFISFDLSDFRKGFLSDAALLHQCVAIQFCAFFLFELLTALGTGIITIKSARSFSNVCL